MSTRTRVWSTRSTVKTKSKMTDLEAEREERIKRNNAMIAELGILEQKSLFEAAFRVVKRPRTAKQTGLLPTRSSGRLRGGVPEFEGLADDFSDGLQPQTKVTSEEQWTQAVSKRRCDSQGRGSVYDSKVGITCHFCRQKKLCGEQDCPRCSERNDELQCIGKSDCSRCGSANGRFCRACLLVRYGLQLEDVREQMAAGTWLCPHCYEAEHPSEGWICNSSICMTRRGLKPTGIAIHQAKQQGFASVAHALQSRIVQGHAERLAKGGKKAAVKEQEAAAAEDSM